MRIHGFAAWRRVVVLAAPLFVAAAAAAQTPCPESEQVGWLGIDGIQCTNCQFMRGRSRFSTEPRITAVAAGSPGVGVIRPGDVIVSVNGLLITTEDGASRFSNLKPGQNVTLLVRRDGELVTARFTNLPGHCSTVSEARALPTPVPPAGGRIGVAAGPARPSRAPGARVGGGGVFGADARAGRPLLQGPARVSRVVFGFGIACEDCSMRLEGVDKEATMIWVFRSPPILYSVETDGPAWRAGLRRGDVITHIDGIEVTSVEAGRRFGAVQPGQTVRFTYRRDNDSRTAPITAVAPAGIVALAAGRPAPTQPTEIALRRMRELLTDISAKEREEQALVERMRQTGDERLAETIEKYRVEQVDQVRKLRELQAQLAVTELRVREILPTRAGSGRGESNPNTIRYSGEIGNVDIEIRGGRPVVVEESADEIIIRTGESEIRLKRRTPR